jgi:hypothetical protein
MVVRGALASLGAGGLGAEERNFMEEQRSLRDKLRREMDEKSRQLQQQRDIEWLHELEDFYLLKPDA